MGEYTTNIAIAFIMAPFFIVLGALPFVERQYRIFGRVGVWSGIVAAAMVLYVCAIVAFTLFPLPTITDEAVFCASRASLAHPQLDLFASIDDIATVGQQAFLQVFFNFLLFVPLGFFLKYRYRKGLVFTVLAGFALSLTVEFTQLTGDWGLYPCPYRLFDVDDLLTNTVGTAVGWVLAVPLLKVLPAAWPRPRADTAPPGLVRRGLGNLLDLALWWLLAGVAWVGLELAGVTSELVSDLVLYVIGFVVLLGIPLLRRDRSGPGRASLHLALVGGRGRLAVLIRFAVFWLPFVVLFAFEAVLLIALLAVAHLVVVLVRTDRRSIAGLAAGTRTVTRAVALDDPPDALEFPERWLADR
ncbi:VanZ family protein [Nonomuraea sp. NPDC050556]|uniref:VanZ family protein n=1 Tax=Nonomuraea sp. NPDC050556 TaxID=3364369 RepID=UPI0037ACB740